MGHKYMGIFIGILGCTIAGAIAGYYAWWCVLAVVLAIFSTGLIADATLFWKDD